MSRQTKSTISELVYVLHVVAKMALGERGSTTSPEDRERLYQAVVAFEYATDGQRLECVFEGDLDGIARLVKRAAKHYRRRTRP